MNAPDISRFCTADLQSAFLSDRPVDVMRFLVDGLKEGHRCALVMLTDIIDGASRPLGALMAVRDDGQYCGFVSGGCVEAAVAREALLALDQDQDRSCRFGKGSPYFDLVLPCGGGIGLTIHVLRDASPIQKLLDAKANRLPGLLNYNSGDATLSFQFGTARTGWIDDIFVSAHRAEPRLLVSGQSMESRLLIALAKSTQLDVLEIDSQSIRALPIDAESAIILLQHDIEKELPILRYALASPAFFIGCLGSRRTHDRRTAILLEEGYSMQQLRRIHAPIGLFGPAREARAVAVSVLAQIFSILEARRA
ncbi:XdhC family protein [Ochrobactrum sp. Q0168]|uniref:XdhC family protein n=1 Tax=Ochrobactrum sp. Q0168 TaxID=2793241 RepID=UPI0018ECAC47|nr:XdhC family protein [Ochrobactrum sp. Q0168]